MTLFSLACAVTDIADSIKSARGPQAVVCFDNAVVLTKACVRYLFQTALWNSTDFRPSKSPLCSPVFAKIYRRASVILQRGRATAKAAKKDDDKPSCVNDNWARFSLLMLPPSTSSRTACTSPRRAVLPTRHCWNRRYACWSS